MAASAGCPGIVPPYLLRRLAQSRPEMAAALDRMLTHDEDLRLLRGAPSGSAQAAAGPEATTVPWVIYTAKNGSTLPGSKVRGASDPESSDPAVNEAATGIAGTLSMYQQVYDRDSWDDRGAQVIGSVHYERDYDNAFWNGQQMVFGDGDGTVFTRFTIAPDVIGHELTHAVTQATAGLAYEGQSGALNESVSDVFGSCLKQRLLGQTAAEGDWLIGAGLFVPGIQGRALRDMAHPGTAYDDPSLGQDPQPADMAHYVDTTDDNGGVHTNSGIPNRAFYLAATAVGGSSADGAGRIWYAALTGGQVTAQTDFAGFAAATVAAAGEHADAVRTAWETVGVTPTASGAAPGLAPPVAASGGPSGQSSGPASGGEQGVRTVRVVRRGGLAGLTREGQVDLDGPQAREDVRAAELAGLVDRIDLEGVRAEPPHPDMFTYDFDLAGRTAALPEHALTPDLRRVADLVLGGPDRPITG